MTNVFSIISVFFLPVLIITILAYGIKSKIAIYDAFIKGAKEGLHTCVEILPFMIGIFIAIEALTTSGAMNFIEALAAPFFNLFGVPEELISVILLRPVSGSSSIAVVQTVMESAGPDSFVGRCAAVMVGSCETVFYVLALYFGVTAVKKMRHAVAAGLIGYLAGIFASIYICKIL